MVGFPLIPGTLDGEWGWVEVNPMVGGGNAFYKCNLHGCFFICSEIEIEIEISMTPDT